MVRAHSLAAHDRQDTMTEKAATGSVPEDVPHDAVEEPIRRRSGRPAKKKVREY